jgi:hypothetical protein
MEIPGIELVKRRDGSVVLRMTRGDGSMVWQTLKGSHAAFFPFHDLTHYAVESVLRLGDGFFGLLAAGWSIEETQGKSARGPLPTNAFFVEAVVGTFDTERASMRRWTAAEFNDSLATHMTSVGRTVPLELTEEDLGRIRTRRAELFQQWDTLGEGDSLSLPWDVPLAPRDGTASGKD